MKIVAIGLLFLSCFLQDPTTKPSEPADAAAKTAKKKVVKTNQEWQKLLTREQFRVTRLKGTEPAFSGKYVDNHAKGVYHCVCCEEPLFKSSTKFESGTGWPSFYQPIDKGQVTQELDYSVPTEVRMEVNCATCGAHLGHVFNDGPEPTGLRFCINSASLKFAKDAAKPATKPAAKTAAKTTTKPAAKPEAETKKTP